MQVAAQGEAHGFFPEGKSWLVLIADLEGK